MTLAEIALELLEKYKAAKTSVIYEFSGSISKKLAELDVEIEKYRSEIENCKKEEALRNKRKHG